MKRAAIFAHFNLNNQIANYVFHYIKSLLSVVDKVIFVSTSDLPADAIQKLKSMNCDVIIRENIGYDFMSWKVGLQTLSLNDYDEIIICNDSVFGPLYGFDKLFKKMENLPVDFWGITNSYEINEHIQSYFIVFRKQAMQSQNFDFFWKTIKHEKSKYDIVKNYEITLTDTLRKEGLVHTVLATYKRWWALEAILKNAAFRLKNKSGLKILCSKLLHFSANPTHDCWQRVLNQGSPFIKVDLLRTNPSKVQTAAWKKFISKKYPNFDINLIEDHLNSTEISYKI
jgi:rhamnosyltransferase